MQCKKKHRNGVMDLNGHRVKNDRKERTYEKAKQVQTKASGCIAESFSTQQRG